MKKSVVDKSTYFASVMNPVQLASEMQAKISIYRNWCASMGFTGMWLKKLTNYYGNSAGGNSSHEVTRGGTKGELALVKVNEMRALLQEQLVTVTSQRPAGKAKAINTDTTSMKAARIGDAIAEYYMSQLGFEAKFISCAEIALLCDEGFVDLFWDKTAGDPIVVDPETGMPMMSGDMILRKHAPWMMARDIGATVENTEWYIITYKMNKFNAAASYPKFASRILAVTEGGLPELPMETISEGSDQIFGHLLVHDRTPAIPSGRYSLMIGDTIVLDQKLPFEDFPVERMTSSDIINIAMGYSASNDMLVLEQITDALNSVIVTNQTTFGGQCLKGPKGANLSIEEIAKGVRYFELEPDHVEKLQAMDLLHTAPEIFGYLQTLSDKKQKMVGSVGSILEQQASKGASGSSMALIQAKAISSNSGIQRAYFALLSSTMTKLIGGLRKYADTPRVARIVGKSKAAYLKEFKYTGKDLSSISSIVYELVNPVFQTYGGRLTFAQDLLSAGQVKSPKQYLNVIESGNLDSMTDDDEADQLLILEENEWLTEGKPFKAIITQNHADHIRSHNSQITLEMTVSDPEGVARILEHCQEHIDLWMTASQSNPALLLATNQQPLFLPAGENENGNQAPKGETRGVPQGNEQEVAGPGIADVAGEAQEVNLPSLPTIAGTGGEKPTFPGVIL